MRKVQILCCLLTIAVSVARSQWSPATFPNPQIEPSRCGRGHTSRSWVCDPDGLLSRQSGDVIEGILKSIASGEHPYARAGSCGDRRASQGYQVGSCMCGSTQTHGLQIHCKAMPTHLKRSRCLYSILERFAKCSFRQVKASFLLSADTVIVLGVSIYDMQMPLAQITKHST